MADPITGPVSGTFSPTLERSIGLARVPSQTIQGSTAIVSGSTTARTSTE